MKWYWRMNRHYRKKHKRLASFYQKLIRVFYSCDLPCSVEIGEGSELMHGGLGTVIHQRAVIGKNCKIYQNVTIAGNTKGEVPVIGDNVLIGTGSFIMGGLELATTLRLVPTL